MLTGNRLSIGVISLAVLLLTSAYQAHLVWTPASASELSGLRQTKFIADATSITRKPYVWGKKTFYLSCLPRNAVLPPVPIVTTVRGHYVFGFLSPDKSWLLQDNSDRQETLIRLRDGWSIRPKPFSQAQYWADASHPCWLPDSRRWVRLEAGGKSLYAIVQARGVAAPLQTTAIGMPRWTSMWPDLMPSDLLGLIGPDRILAKPQHDGYQSLDGKEPFYSFQLGGGLKSVRQFDIHLPPGTRVYNALPALSPDGRFLAWLLAETNTTASREVRYKGFLLAVCRSDGTGMHVVSRIPREGIIRDSGDMPRQLYWLRGSRQMEFVYQGMLWTVGI